MLRSTLVLLTVVCGPAVAFPEGPEPGFTGGMGEESCASCHFAGPAKGERSGLQLRGLAEALIAGAKYPLELELTDLDGRVAGFQIAFRDAEGRSVGELIANENQALTQRGPVTYLAHSAAAPMRSAAEGNRSARWHFVWQAPPQLEGTLFIHAAAVAGNDDDSALGDNVYELKREIPIP